MDNTAAPNTLLLTRIRLVRYEGKYFFNTVKFVNIYIRVTYLKAINLKIFIHNLNKYYKRLDRVNSHRRDRDVSYRNVIR